MGWIALVVLLLVLAYILYLGNRGRQERKLEQAREADKLESSVNDHREMSADHQARADALKEEAAQLEHQAEREMTKAARHEVKADELAPDPEASDR